MLSDRTARSAIASRTPPELAPIHRLSAICDGLAKTTHDPRRPARNAVRMQLYEQLRVIQRNC